MASKAKDEEMGISLLRFSEEAGKIADAISTTIRDCDSEIGPDTRERFVARRNVYRTDAIKLAAMAHMMGMLIDISDKIGLYDDDTDPSGLNWD